MKTLKMLSMLFFAAIFSLGFISCGDDDDNKNIQEPVTTTDFSKVIPGHWANTASSETIGINYNGTGTIALQDLVDNYWGVSAYGTYSLNGSQLTANYTRVEVIDANWEPTTYHGFTDSKSKTVVYTIVSCDGKKLVMKNESGQTLNYEKYKEVN